jgi:hypothetical protein
MFRMGHQPRPSDLFQTPDDPDTITPGWTQPVLFPRAYTGDPPPMTATCLDCGSQAWWSDVADPPTRMWRCLCCIPCFRPADRYRVVFTDAAQ